MHIPGFGRLTGNPRGKDPCFSCGKQTEFLYDNPNGLKTPCCTVCYTRIFTFTRQERTRNLFKRRLLQLSIAIGVGLAIFLVLVQIFGDGNGK